MKYIDEYRNKVIVKDIIKAIEKISIKNISLMEVCGGHTMSIRKFGINSLLPSTIKLLSGPGCPVCVSSRKFIDTAIAFGRLNNVIITTFGDLVRVPGSSSTLEKEKALGRDTRIVMSPLEALQIAKDNPNKKVVFLGIGFETTAPGSAVTVNEAYNQNIKNFSLLSSHKIMPPAMEALIDEGVKLNGYIAPGHVSTITGSGIYKTIPEKFNLGVVISGFEPTDILHSIYMLTKQIEEDNYKVEIQYKRAVKPEGNLLAQKSMNETFELRDDWWRGFGIIPQSGLTLNNRYAEFDAEKTIEAEIEPTKSDKGCICGEILKGLKTPKDCKLFENICTPINPVGACMVSSEGSCAAYYKYR